MKYYILSLVGIILMAVSCKETKKEQMVGLEKIYAWCIVPYDSVNRSPLERIHMLKALGITKYAYDWRNEHLPFMAEELRLAKENAIDVIAVWLWIDEQWDSLEKLNDTNEKVFQAIEEAGYKGQLWVSFNANFFENLADKDAVEKGAGMIAMLSKRAASLGCKVALYNHGDWFGEPENQIKIVKALPDEELGLVYNFHHAHQQIESFSQMVTLMMPWLWSVNLNGLKKDGPKILPVGKGDYEKEMIEVLIEKGYRGNFGILGHVEDADVKTILQGNIKGLTSMSFSD